MYFEQKICEIIYSNNIDEVYPGYKGYIQAQRIIDELLASWTGKKVLCVCNSIDNKFYFENRMQGGDTAVEFIVIQYGSLDKPTNSELQSAKQSIKFEEYDEICVVSYYGFSVIGHFLRMDHIKYTWLYDYFAMNGLYLEKEWYDFLHDENSLISYETKSKLRTKRNAAVIEYFDLTQRLDIYKKTGNKDLVCLTLRKLVFVSLFIHNFIEAIKWNDEYISLSGEEFSRQINRDVEALIADIRNAAKKRNCRDIIIHWIDKVPYRDLKKAEFLYDDLINKSVFFSQMYTMSPYTVPSFVQMFAKKRPVDDGGWGEWFSGGKSVSDYCVIKDIEASGYRFMSLCRDFRNFPNEYIPPEPIDAYACVSDVLWTSLNCTLNSDKPMVVLAHISLETHEPFWSTKMTDNSIHNNDDRYNLGIQAVDEQIRFYDGLYSDNQVGVYLSDHGKEDYQSRFHCFFAIKSVNRYSPQVVDELCCWLDFGTILHSLMNDEELPIKKIRREYVQLQEYDWLDGRPQAKAFRDKEDISWFLKGFRGAVNKKYIYLKFTNGVEWVIKNDENHDVFEPMWFQREGDIETISDDELESFRKWAGKNARDDLEKYYKYNKFARKVFEHAYEHEINKIIIVNDIFNGLSDEKVYLRMGGQHSYFLYSILSLENRKRISAIIDCNMECFCKSLQLPIIPEPPSDGVVILSSFDHVRELREESKEYEGVKVIDIYEELMEKGYHCRFPVYCFEPYLDEYDVGFPFDEFDMQSL